MMRRSSVSLAVRINARCDEFERAWRDGSPPRVEQFAAGWKDSERTALLRELVGLDAQYRVAFSEEVTLPDYATTFPELSTGAVVDVPCELGPYILLELVGSGGMGTVYRGVHQRMKRDVAVKVLRAGLESGDRARLRELFELEIRAAARLSHPNIVTAYDAGEEGEVPYLVSEFVEGDNLASVVRRDGPLAVDVALDFVLQAARGLQYAHEQGVIHRDVKPANLLLDGKGVVRVMDVGLARLNESTSGRRNRGVTLGTLGTPGYMAPEQADDAAAADARSDVYSLGCTLYFLLTGRHMSAQTSAAPSLERELARVIPLLRKMLSRRPEERHQSMGDVVKHLENLRQGGTNGRKLKLLGVGCLIVMACLLFGNDWQEQSAFNEQTSAVKARPDAIVTLPATGMQFRLIPAGERWVGSAEWEIERMLSWEPHPDMRQRIRGEKRRMVRIDRPFYMGTTEVTVGQFRKFVEASGYVSQVEREKRPAYGRAGGSWVQEVGYSWKNLGQPLTDDHPVCNVTYADAAAFCEWLTLASGKDPSGPSARMQFRLPRESEWEYACRAGADWTWPFGRTASLLEVYAWCRPNCGATDNQVRPVATRSANAYGLFDMLGNVQELCIDDLSPSADTWTPKLVLKGGNISGGALHVRPAARNVTDAHSAEGGFRMVMEPRNRSAGD